MPVLCDHYTQRLYNCPALYYMLLSHTSVVLSCYYLYIDMNSSAQKALVRFVIIKLMITPVKHHVVSFGERVAFEL